MKNDVEKQLQETNMRIKGEEDQIATIHQQGSKVKQDADRATGTTASSWWRSTSQACTPWPWRSSSSPQRSACKSQCAEEAPPCPPSPLTALMPNSPTQINAGINTRV